MNSGIYIHIPFCLSKCRYCDFNSRPLPSGSVPDRYLAALGREISAPRNTVPGRPESVYIGGGTPSLLSLRQLEDMFSLLWSLYPRDPGAEVTVEANPGTVGREWAQGLRDLGINRVSLGIQSFEDRLLRRIGRVHTRSEALKAYSLLREAGIGNISFDLIYGLPGQTLEDWRRELEQALDLEPDHLSLYPLTIEEGTPLARERVLGTLSLPGEGVSAEMYRLAAAIAAGRGYEHYEFSSWARPGCPSLHNTGCWTMRPYRGFGAGAHSFRPDPAPVRFANPTSIEDYCALIEGGDSPGTFREEISPRTLAGETLLLGLRLFEGVSATDFRVRFDGAPADLFPEALELGFERKWLVERGGRIAFTPEGALFSDEVFLLLV